MIGVLDASVAAKWFLPPRGEDFVEKALELFRAYDSGLVEFFVPDIFWAEIGNIAWKAVRRRRWPLSEAVEAIETTRSLLFPTFPSQPLLERGFKISSTAGVSLYDALYVALAESSEATLITADARLVNALGTRFPVRWLGSFSST